ncbi:molybdopterin molybdotransferase MoeA [Helicobacter sp. WB40]|uniref:molybdopterin molybdotransferase MoeA n=1 Tax=Helicobacter sp. WB40 TaxID=3004130 RepID=UPI0022EBF2B1|nr:molybdopterin molybdotransferase MoeA [Helicobacter sp. WB40]MDA3967867.1 molybdopterin molybdotransferase MoeA [Helicobacter sp. WB40]
MELTQAIKALELAGRNFKLETQILPLSSLNKRILSEDIICQKSLPAFDNSAMDGFACCLSDRQSKVIGTILAGDFSSLSIKSGESIKIMTGAKIPNGADFVVPFEEVEGGFSAEKIVLNKEYQKGQNIRIMGEEVSKGNILLSVGDELDSSALMILASQGISHASVYEKLKICVFSSGDELKEPWESAADYQIYNSNTTMIIENLKEVGIECSYGGVLRDDKDSIRAILDSAYDVIFTTGGASKGEADFMREILSENGEFIVDFINIKPGKPIMVSKYRSKNRDKFIVALPGNPLASCVLLKFLIIPFLRQLSGASAHYLQYISLKNTESFRKKNRVEAMLGDIKNGEFSVVRGYTSGEILPIFRSSAIAIFSQDRCDIESKDQIKILPFKSLWGKIESNYIN